ncbi:hypothetical protein HYS92_00620 [Candidatus Daviesbacteria bacterium]|nr:hypothetical protein [Candidatus Daviesbacteria bacterium]
MNILQPKQEVQLKVNMPGKTIATIYFYLISAASLALIVIGIFNAVNFIINTTQYDKYPPKYGPPVVDCEEGGYFKYGAPRPLTLDGVSATPSAEESKKLKEQCEKQLELDRKQHLIDDLKNALTFSLVGTVLFLIHFPLARKQSKG